MYASGTIIDPVLSRRRLDRSVEPQDGCSITARIAAGTSRLSVGLCRATACSHAAGSNRLCKVTLAPAKSAGSVWMFRPPTWNIGSAVSTWSRSVSSCA
jgi:hypothetical protein